MLIEKTRIKSNRNITTLYLYDNKVVVKTREDGKYYQQTITNEPCLTKTRYAEWVKMKEDHAFRTGKCDSTTTMYI